MHFNWRARRTVPTFSKGGGSDLVIHVRKDSVGTLQDAKKVLLLFKHGEIMEIDLNAENKSKYFIASEIPDIRRTKYDKWCEEVFARVAIVFQKGDPVVVKGNAGKCWFLKTDEEYNQILLNLRLNEAIRGIREM